MSFIAAAIIGGAAVVGAGALAYAGASKSAKAVESSTRAGIESQEKASDESLRLLQAAVDAGEIDIEEATDKAQQILAETADPFAFNIARGYLQDPSQVFDLPGTEFQFEQGQRALENLLSKTTGGGLSGAGVEAAQEFGQNFAATQIDKALNRLIPFINIEQGARTNIANLEAGRGTQLANLRIAGAGGSAEAVRGAGTNIAQLQQQQGINLANIQGGLTTNMGNLSSGFAESLITANVAGQKFTTTG